MQAVNARGRGRRRIRRLPWVGVPLLLLGLAAWLLQDLAGVGSAFTAKYLCSQVFVAGREAGGVAREDPPAFRSPILDRARWQVDTAHRQVRADILGLGRREALYRPGLGCTLALEGPPAPVPMAECIPFPAVAPFPPAARAPPALQRVVDAAFHEPDPSRLRRTRAILVLHRGHTLIERYAPGYGADTRFPGWSMGKSVLNALLGTLVA